eukprot:CAMPEP_0201275310 /NCGR_PEP_ID=MMETSP0853-20130426/52351_1 /ASSEMBLY_ACC=CAM_ASM_000640 /TAXON_ID=183588 /ORGANISM="Pseudo-nitzschia fraudulenta, Strain WWA7" /LENGTH=63 /DNA_ID=CAMNT_0047582935 /DNA_START=396 /DNA_END=587 /DNA_ORIENTATION=-
MTPNIGQQSIPSSGGDPAKALRAQDTYKGTAASAVISIAMAIAIAIDNTCIIVDAISGFGGIL